MAELETENKKTKIETKEETKSRKPKKETKKKTENNVVYIGRKPAMSYVLACVTQFNDGKSNVILKARGRAISHAVDVAEIVRNKFITDAEIKDVSIGTEQVESDQGEKINVSSIEIILGKK